MAVVGGYAFTPFEAEVDIHISAAGNDEYRSIELKSGRWNGIGCHLECPIGELTIRGEISFNLQEMPGSWIDIFGIDIAPLDFWIYRDNIRYDDEKTAQERFFEDEFQYTPAKYHIETDRRLQKQHIRSDVSALANGRVVALKACNRAPDHFHPIEIGEKAENICETFVNHTRNDNLRVLRSESTVDPYEVVDGKIGERVIRPRKFNTSRRSPGFLHDNVIYSAEFDIEGLELDRGYQYECNACKKFEVNSEGNPRRSKEQLFEDSQRRRSIQRLLEHERILGIERSNNFRKTVIEEFGGCFICDENDSDKIEIDHLMPLVYLWPLKGNAVPLCKSCHKRKGTTFPRDFYDRGTREELLDSNIITIGQDIHKRKVNEDALDSLLENIDWFFDSFLEEIKKKNETKADVVEKVVSSLHRHFRRVGDDTNLISEYKNENNELPDSIDEELIEN